MIGKIYLENPYLKDLKGEVIKKEKKDNSYHIVLNRTIFYPRYSEGESVDSGSINGIDVIDVFEEKGEIIHVIRENISSKDIIMKIDWNKRFDYMQQHTGQHILSTSIDKLCGATTLNFRFDEKYSYIIIDFKSLNDSDISRIEKFANHMIYSNFEIKSIFKKVEDNNLRHISIGNIDTAPCEGIHCSSTGEVGIIKIMDFKKNEEELMELRFVCGSRALKDYGFKNNIINEIALKLSVESTDIIRKIEKILS